MMHAAKKMKEPYKILKSLLKLLSSFKIRIWYEKDDFTEDIGIKCNKVAGYE